VPALAVKVNWLWPPKQTVLPEILPCGNGLTLTVTALEVTEGVHVPVITTS
jgi:hypothetical protein